MRDETEKSLKWLSKTRSLFQNILKYIHNSDRKLRSTYANFFVILSCFFSFYVSVKFILLSKLLYSYRLFCLRIHKLCYSAWSTDFQWAIHNLLNVYCICIWAYVIQMLNEQCPLIKHCALNRWLFKLEPQIRFKRRLTSSYQSRTFYTYL